MFPPVKKQRMLPEGSDRISDLQDSLLRDILAHLVTKEAVATSLLSRRWKFLWMSIPCLDFHFYKRGKYTEFIAFVDHVLHLNNCRLLDKFNLVWYPKSKSISSSVTNTWIDIVITKNVRDLSLRCVGPQGPSKYEYSYNFVCLNASYVVPSNVFCCGSLHYLELIGCIISVDDETVISLPNLESLTMSPVTFKSEQACQMILTGCPLLKFLHLNISHGDFECTITSDTMIRLELLFEGQSECIFNLRKAPALEYLRLKGGCISEISIDTSLVSLVEAHFDVQLSRFPIKFNNSIVEAIRAFHFVKVLTLSFDALQAIAKATISLSTEFKRLVKLVAGTCTSIIDFIYHSENLQVLIIQKDEDKALHGSRFSYQSKRNNLEEVPRCLSNSLKEVRIISYNDLKDDNEMIRFMLQHGSVLEIMKISCTEAEGDSDSDNAKTREGKFKLMKQKIRRFPRKSPACRVRFSTN